MHSKGLRYSTFSIYSILLAMCASMELYFTWKLPISFVNIMCACVLLPYLMNLRKWDLSIGVCLLSVVCWIYNFTHNTIDFSLFAYLNLLSVIFITITFFVSTTSFKINLYHTFDFFIKVICCISLLGWLLYLVGINLPHYRSETSDFYIHDVYYFFVMGADNMFEVLPRFCGMFLEPGHVGSTSCLLLYINKFNFKNKSNYIYLLSIIFSLSLAAYCLFFIGLCLYFYLRGKDLFKYLLILAVFAGVFTYIGLNYNRGNNVINEKILSRLIITDGELSGDNRTSMVFDKYYDNWLKHGDIFNGYGRKAYGDGNATSNILHGCASFKRFLFINGIIGTVLICLLYLCLYLRYRSKQGFGFFLVVIICNMIRDYPYRLMWMFLFVLGITVLYTSNKVGYIESLNDK